MTSTQVPKRFGFIFMLIGIPLVLWNAAGASGELDALDAAANKPEARVEQCIANTDGMIPDPSLHRHVCECVVEKAVEQGALEKYGSYDRKLLGPIANECLRGG